LGGTIETEGCSGIGRVQEVHDVLKDQGVSGRFNRPPQMVNPPYQIAQRHSDLPILFCMELNGLFILEALDLIDRIH